MKLSRTGIDYNNDTHIVSGCYTAAHRYIRDGELNVGRLRPVLEYIEDNLIEDIDVKQAVKAYCRYMDRADQLSIPDSVRYLHLLRVSTANDLGIPIEELVEFELALYVHHLDADAINAQLIKWHSPLRINNNYRWIELDSGHMLNDAIEIEDGIDALVLR